MTGQGSLGCNTNQPTIDAGTNCLTDSPRPGFTGPEIRAVSVSPVQARWERVKDWLSELDDALGMLAWWVIGSPAAGRRNGDLEFGPGDTATEHMRNTAAFQEAVEIYQDWLNHGQPLGKYTIRGTDCEYVPSVGYFFVTGRTGAGRGPRGHWSEPLEHPLWGYTGVFSIRFTETGFPKVGYVSVEIENYTSLPSYLHGIDRGNSFLDSLYTKRSGVPILSRSRQVYRFIMYIPRNPVAPDMKVDADTTHTVIAGDSLSALARTYYDDEELWPIIFDRNRDTIGANPDLIKVGKSLVVPARQKLTSDQIKQARQTARSSSRPAAVKVAPSR